MPGLKSIYDEGLYVNLNKQLTLSKPGCSHDTCNFAVISLIKPQVT